MTFLIIEEIKYNSGLIVNYLFHFMIFYYYNSAYEHRFVIYRPLCSYRAVITWVYIGFVNGGFEILWCEYLWLATFPCGGFGGPPQENLEI